MIRIRDVVLVHFALNPDDELTRLDAVAKCSCSPSTVWEALQTMVSDGLLLARRGPGRGAEMFYRPGPALRRMSGLPPEDSK